MDELLKNGLGIWAAVLAGTTTFLPLFVFYLTQFSKDGIDSLLGDKYLPTKYVAWGWSFVLLVMALLACRVTDWTLYAAAPFVAVLSAMIAVNTHQTGADDGANAALSDPGDYDLTPQLLSVAATPVARKKRVVKEAVADTETPGTPS